MEQRRAGDHDWATGWRYNLAMGAGAMFGAGVAITERLRRTLRRPGRMD
jgi:hypothetical protein